MRVLVIGDDRKAAELLVAGLAEEGLVVDVTSSGEAGDGMANGRLRRKIDRDRRTPLIHTVRGRRYMLGAAEA